jgi:hypothetical protein
MPEHAVRLLPHPSQPDAAIHAVSAAVAIDRPAATLDISFRAEGDIARVKIPANAAALRADGLWQHTCFEAFLRADADDAYYELNFSPAGAWAAYRFSGRRAGRESPELAAPCIELASDEDILEMKASVAFAGLPPLARAPLIHLGLAAVIETREGRLSHWALAHRSAAPDFHDPASFTLTVRNA